MSGSDVDVLEAKGTDDWLSSSEEEPEEGVADDRESLSMGSITRPGM